MSAKLQREVDFFLNGSWNKEKPLLLALSGGPDSLTLFSLLKKHVKKKGGVFHVAHIDHGWRKESEEEAFFLKKWLEKEKIPFFLEVLKKEEVKGNLELFCREKRLKFFQELTQKNGYQAVLLGHQRGDLAETVLKRICEGSSFFNLKGIEKKSVYQGMELWRPLLEISKKEIEKYVEKEGLFPFLDPTNKDTCFLRARMREEIFPYLATKFGKEIEGNLAFLGQEALEFDAYLSLRTKPFFSLVTRGEKGFFWDASSCSPFFEVEISYFLKALFKEFQLEGAPLREEMKKIAKALLENKKNKKFKLSHGDLFVDERKVFFKTFDGMKSA